MMLGKARVMFVSELLSLKTFHQLWMEGKIGTTRQNLNYIFGTSGVLHLWMITQTINDKLAQHCFCETDAISPSRVKLEAIFAFFFFFAMLFAMKVIVVYVLNEFNDTGGLKSARVNNNSSWWLRAVNWFVKSAFST